MLRPGCQTPDQGNAMLTGEDGSRPYAPDLAGGSKGLPGNAYAVGKLDTSCQDADGAWIPGTCRPSSSARRAAAATP